MSPTTSDREAIASGRPAAAASLRVVVVYPDLLGTYGDGGNALVLAKRAQWRGVAATVLEAPSDEPLPDGDVYCLGGGEDDPQARAARMLEADGTLRRAVLGGAVVLAVCAGYQILGRSFAAGDGTLRSGLGLLDVRTVRGPSRAVGEVRAEPHRGDGDGPLSVADTLSGFENHAGITVRGPDLEPLGRVVTGTGNGDGTDGVISGRIVGTYLHGPVLARNPALADLLLGWALGSSGALAPLDDERVQRLRRERLAVPAPAARSVGFLGAGFRAAARRASRFRSATGR
jgi:hypothetical protein